MLFAKELLEHCRQGDIHRLTNCIGVLKVLNKKHCKKRYKKLIRKLNKTIKEIQSGDRSNYDEVHGEVIKTIEQTIDFLNYCLGHVDVMI